jgi:ubiquinone/menaquinone biosynthesis C-methylase UbiE
MVDVRAHNRAAWNRQVERGNEWTVPVSSDVIAAARKGQWGIYLTPTKTVPRDWFPADLHGVRILGLASGGGQQGPILAAAGARVTTYDNSPSQLAQDRKVTEREEVEIETVEGDMRELAAFADESFDLIFHPVSNNFVPEVRPIWQEAYRVLRNGGALLAGFGNPVLYLFDEKIMAKEGRLEVRHRLPYDATEAMSPEEIRYFAEQGEPLEFSHTLEDQIGGQLDAGFVLTGFYEDSVRNPERDPLCRYMDTFIATRAVKMAGRR